MDGETYLISNSEVFDILNKHVKLRDASYNGEIDISLEDLHTVEKEIIIYLRKSGKCLDKVQMAASMSLFDEYKLTMSEKLVIINIQPENVVELHCTIDEIDERLTREQQEKLLERFKSIIGTRD